MSTRLSKLGKVALFQTTDFHYPYRKWSIDFREDSILYKLHSHSVELSFIIEVNHCLIIFSSFRTIFCTWKLKLETNSPSCGVFTTRRCPFRRWLNRFVPVFPLFSTVTQLIRHGVYLFASPEILAKHKDIAKVMSSW